MMSDTDIMNADDIYNLNHWTKWEKEPLLDEKGPSSIQTTLELFQGWGNFWDIGQRA